MKIHLKHIFLGFVLLSLALFSCVHSKSKRDIIFQNSTFNALLKSVFDGNITYKELKQYGDVGIGTFDSLDGEMIALDGEFYQIKDDGLAYRVSDDSNTPFAVVTFFDTDKMVMIDTPFTLKHLEVYLDTVLPTKNIIYALRIKGEFPYMKTRSVPKQKKPYPPISEVIKKQKVFEFQNVRGTMIGFRFPEYMKGQNVPGYHFHFLTVDNRAGGHVLDAQIEEAEAHIDYSNKLYLVLPDNDQFYQADLSEEE
jgi:acetolactate decarboxylase